MKILVLNSGSSSIKFQLFKMESEESICGGIIEQIGEELGHVKFDYSGKSIKKEIKIPSHQEGIEILESLLIDNGVIKSFDEIGAVGHRVVHGGEYFSEPIVIDKDVIRKIEEISPLAPLHNPVNLMGINAILSLSPKTRQVAVFDTAFHQSIPKHAYTYALPYSFYKENFVRRYGFHGTSHYYVSKMGAEVLGKSPEDCNFITLHLGNGASACAVKNGKSVDTSMGLTPLEGLVMGTRSGDIDPAIIFYLSRELGLNIKELDSTLNKKSGLKGICGTNDLREIQTRVEEGDELAKLALEIFCYRIKKYIGSYFAVLGNVDAIIFTGGIGEHSKIVREKVCESLKETFGIEIDPEKNSQNETFVNSNDSKVKLLVIPTNEELEIAKQTFRMVR